MKISELKHYLRSLKWDGTKRLDTWLTTYAGVETSESFTDEIVGQAGNTLLHQLVGRVLHPPMIHPYLVIFYGEQGIGKTRLLRTLADKTLYGTTPLEALVSDAIVKSISTRAWIIEVTELLRALNNPNTLMTNYLAHLQGFEWPAEVFDIVSPYSHSATYFCTAPEYLKFDNEEAFNLTWQIPITKEPNFKLLERDREQLFAEAAKGVLDQVKKDTIS